MYGVSRFALEEQAEEEPLRTGREGRGGVDIRLVQEELHCPTLSGSEPSHYDLIFHSRMLKPSRSLTTADRAERMTTRVML